MELIDTHCHLDYPDFKDDLDEVIKRAEENGVKRIIIPGTDIKSSESAVEIAGKYENIYAACGIHPHEADNVAEGDLVRLRELLVDNDKVVAIGEIGLDYYRKNSTPENQKKLLRNCLEMAQELEFPVILHNRDAGKDLIEILKEYDLTESYGVVHCFSGDMDFLKEVLSLNFFVSFAGNITFKKAEELRELAAHVPLEKLLLETDSPYLTPVPHRGKRNEPSYVANLLDVHAELYGVTKEDIARITTHNANHLFRMGAEKKDTVTYVIRDSIYINVTHRCTDKCPYCTRYKTDYVKGHNLRLDREPTVKDMIESLGDVTKYKEVVFCGLGEPTLRLGAIKKVAAYVKKSGIRVRINTNGEGNLVWGRSIAPELKGLIDRVSVSVNASDADLYQKICKSNFGKKAYNSQLEFIKECRENDIEVEMTCMDFVGEKVVDDIRKMAEEFGADLRVRKMNAVG